MPLAIVVEHPEHIPSGAIPPYVLGYPLCELIQSGTETIAQTWAEKIVPTDDRPQYRFVFAFIVSSSTPNILVERLVSALPEGLQNNAVYILGQEPDSESQLAYWLSDRLAFLFDELLRSYAKSHVAIAATRKRVYELEKVVATVEKTFLHLNYSTVKLGFRREPSGSFAPPPVANPCTQPSLTLTQRVHMRLANITAIDFFFNRSGLGLLGSITVKMTKAYSERVICEANIDFPSVKRGWNQIACEDNEGTDREPLLIELSICGRDAAHITPALATINPVEGECARIGNEKLLPQPLALQIWTGLSKIKSKLNALVLNDSVRTRRTEPRSVPKDAFKSFEIMQLANPSPGFNPVSFDESLSALLVHPLGTKPTVVRLPSLSLPNLKRVTATVEIRRSDGQPTEFAIIVVPASQRTLDSDPASDSGADQIRGLTWLYVNGGESAEIQVEVAQPIADEVDIYILTRNRTENNEFSWAFVSNIDAEF